jgi:methionine-rich copper-binding protein CopC
MSLRPVLRAATLSAVLGTTIALGTPSAHAAAAPVVTSPMRFAALIHAPRVIRLRFSEAIVMKSSGVTLTDLAGHQVQVIPVKSHGNDSIQARIAAKLPAGVYRVHWEAVSAIDGAKTSGSYQFTVQ